MRSAVLGGRETCFLAPSRFTPSLKYPDNNKNRNEGKGRKRDKGKGKKRYIGREKESKNHIRKCDLNV